MTEKVTGGQKLVGHSGPCSQDWVPAVYEGRVYRWENKLVVISECGVT